MALSPSFLPQHLDAGQDLAFQPLQECAARGRDIGETVGDARGVERRDGVATARYGNKLACFAQFRRSFGYFDRTIVEWFHFECAKWTVPDQRLAASEHG